MKKGNGKRVLAGFLAVLLVATSFTWNFGEAKAEDATEETTTETKDGGQINFDDINVADLENQGYSSTKFTNGNVVAGEIDKAPQEHWFSGDGEDTPYGTSTPASKNTGIKPNTANDADRYFLYTPYSYEDFKVSTEIYYGAFSGVIIGEKNVYPTSDGTGSSIAVFFNSGRIHIMGAVDWSTATITRGTKAAKSSNGSAKGYAIFNNGDGVTISAAQGKVYTLNVMKQGKHLTIWISGGAGVMTIDITDTYKTGWVGLQSRGYHGDCGGFKSLKVTKINAIEKQDFDNINMQELDDLGYTARTSQKVNGTASDFSKVLNSTSDAWFSGSTYPTGTTVNNKNDGIKTKSASNSYLTSLNIPYVYENFRLKATVYKGQVLGITLGAKDATPRSGSAISLYINGKYLEVQGALKFGEAKLKDATDTSGSNNTTYHFVPKSNSDKVVGQECTIVLELKDGMLSFWQEGYDGVATIPVTDAYKGTKNIALFQRQYNVNGTSDGGGFKSYEIYNLDAGDAQSFDDVKLSNLSAAGYTATKYTTGGAVAGAEGAVSSYWFSGQSDYTATTTVKNDGLKTTATGQNNLTALNIPHVYENFRLKTTVYKGQVIGVVIGKKGVSPRIGTYSNDEISIYINGAYLAISGAIQIDTRTVNAGVSGIHATGLFQFIPRKNGKPESTTAWGEVRTIVVEMQNGVLSVWYEGYDDVARIQVADTYVTENIALFQRQYDANGGGFKSYEIEKLSDTNIGTTVDLEGYTDFEHVNADVLDAKGFTSTRISTAENNAYTEEATKISDHWFAGEIGKSATVAVSSNVGLKPNMANNSTTTLLNTPYTYEDFRMSTEVYWGSYTGIVLGERNVYPTGDTASAVKIYFNANQIQLTGGGVDYDTARVSGGSASWNFASAPVYIFKPDATFKYEVGAVYKLNVEMKDGILTIWVDGYDGVLTIKTSDNFKQEVIALVARKYNGDDGGLKSLKVEVLDNIVKPYTKEQFEEIRSQSIDEKHPYKVPEYKDYLFAGWFTDEACVAESAVELDAKTVEGTVYAKFIPKYVLDVKAQVSGNLIDTDFTDDSEGAIRFLTSIDTTDYRTIGFELRYDKGDGSGVKIKPHYTRTVYKTLYASAGNTESGSTSEEYSPENVFCKASHYFKACTVKGLNENLYDMEFVVTPRYQTLDGSWVDGTPATKTVTQGINQAALYEKTALFVGDSIQKGNHGKDDPYGKTPAGWAGRLEDYGISGDNVAQDSATLTNDEVSGTTGPQIITQFDARTKDQYDLVILEGGVNDVLIKQDTNNPYNNIPWGTINHDLEAEITDDNIAGAMQLLIMKAKELFPDAKVVYIINHYFGANPENMRLYMDMVEEACEVHEIDYINLNDAVSYPTLEPLTTEKIQPTYSDEGIHPNKAGYELSTPVIATCLRKILKGEVAKEVYVSEEGKDAIGRGTMEQPYKTLNYAVNQVADNGTVHVKGTLATGTNVNTNYFLGGNGNNLAATNVKQVTIEGCEGQSSTIDFSAAEDLNLNVAVTLQNIQVKWPKTRVWAEGNRFKVAETAKQTTDSADTHLFGGSSSQNVTRTDLEIYAGNYTVIVGGQTKGTVGETHVTVGGNVNTNVCTDFDDQKSHSLAIKDGGRNLFGGNWRNSSAQSVVSGDTYVTVEKGANFNYVYGGGGGKYGATGIDTGYDVKGSTYVEFSGEAYGVYGGCWRAAVENGTTVKIMGGRVAQVFGGSEDANVTGNTDVQILGGTIYRRVYGGSYNEEYNKTSYGTRGNTSVTIGKDATLLLNSGGTVDKGLSGCSRTHKTPEGETGVVILQDGVSEPTWAGMMFAYTTYHYLVKAGTNGKVYAAGDRIYVVPDSKDYTAIVTYSDGTELSPIEENENGAYYLLSRLETEKKTIINVTFNKAN